jgi:hypothetical protein
MNEVETKKALIILNQIFYFTILAQNFTFLNAFNSKWIQAKDNKFSRKKIAISLICPIDFLVVGAPRINVELVKFQTCWLVGWLVVFI